MTGVNRQLNLLVMGIERLRVLYVTFEYHAAQFSGNGTASMSFVRGMRELGAEVLVVCGGPKGSSEISDQTICYEVSSWMQHGRDSAWQEWSNAIETSDPPAVLKSFSPNIVVGVDWESSLAIEKLLQKLQSKDLKQVYYNYRVFYMNSNNSEEDKEWYKTVERRAIVTTQQTICLCNSDRLALSSILSEEEQRRSRISILLPGLRQEIKKLALMTDCSRKPRYLLCCVRIIEEKNVDTYVDVVRILKENGFLKRKNLIPYLIGASSSEEYRTRIENRLRDVCFDCVVSDFVSPSKLFEIMRESYLNIHPALNEAYGMTIIESAAAACPSVIHNKNIGAADLLDTNSEVFASDMSNPEKVAEMIISIDDELYNEVQNAGRMKALSHGEHENASLLLNILRTTAVKVTKST